MYAADTPGLEERARLMTGVAGRGKHVGKGVVWEL